MWRFTGVHAHATLPSLQIIQDMLKDYGPAFTENEVAITQNKVRKGSTLTCDSGTVRLLKLNEIRMYGK